MLGRGRRGRRNQDESDNIVIDLTDHVIERDGMTAEDFLEHRRAAQRRREAEQELARLRTRHWTGERLVEEGARNLQFWEHDEADPYAVLGILPGASLDEAAEARKRIAMDCHPDRSAAGVLAPDAARRMSSANAAYERLRQALRPIG